MMVSYNVCTISICIVSATKLNQCAKIGKAVMFGFAQKYRLLLHVTSGDFNDGYAF